MVALREELEIMQPNGFGYEAFLKWHESRNGKPFSSDKYDPEDAAPRSDGTLFTQKLAVALGVTRDRHILDVISDALSKHDRVLVVYGASHLAELRGALEEALGKPRLVTQANGR
jgi:hypothetical protein